MKRLLVFALAASLGHVPAAFAGGSLLQSGTRHVQEMANAAATVNSPAAAVPTTSNRAKRRAHRFRAVRAVSKLSKAAACGPARKS